MNTPTFGIPAPQGLQMPSSRYILPQFEERTAYGYKRQDPYNKLFEDRVIFRVSRRPGGPARPPR